MRNEPVSARKRSCHDAVFAVLRNAHHEALCTPGMYRVFEQCPWQTVHTRAVVPRMLLRVVQAIALFTHVAARYQTSTNQTVARVRGARSTMILPKRFNHVHGEGETRNRWRSRVRSARVRAVNRFRRADTNQTRLSLCAQKHYAVRRHAYAF